MDPIDALQPPTLSTRRQGDTAAPVRSSHGPGAAASVEPSGVTDTNGRESSSPLLRTCSSSRPLLFTWQMAYEQSHAFRLLFRACCTVSRDTNALPSDRDLIACAAARRKLESPCFLAEDLSRIQGKLFIIFISRCKRSQPI
jgi:hypothetical protein